MQRITMVKYPQNVQGRAGLVNLETGLIRLELSESQESKDLKKLIELKKELRDFWEEHDWTDEYLTTKEEAKLNLLYRRIRTIEDKDIFCTCTRCDDQDDSVCYHIESTEEMICAVCQDEIIDEIRDKKWMVGKYCIIV